MLRVTTILQISVLVVVVVHVVVVQLLAYEQLKPRALSKLEIAFGASDIVEHS